MGNGYARVVNIKGDRDYAPEADETVIRGDRANPVFGNPHHMRGKTASERRRVIDAFLLDVERDAEANGPISKEIRALAARCAQGEKIALACWCKPMECHLDPIAAKINQMAIALRTQMDAQESADSKPRPKNI